MSCAFKGLCILNECRQSQASAQRFSVHNYNFEHNMLEHYPGVIWLILEKQI